MNIFSTYLKLFITVIFIFQPLVSFGSEIIDAELNNVLGKIANPIFRAANLKHPKIIVINNPTPNAFTAGGEVIYIHTGLLIEFPDPEIIRGVIAHETGHITSNHVARTREKIHAQQKLAATSLILGIIGAGVSGNPEAAIHGAFVGSHIAERSILKFSRENENSADIKAIQYLNKSGNSTNGLLKLLESLRSNQRNLSDFRYDLTHPLNDERIKMLKSYSSPSPKIDDDLKLSLKMVSAKLLSHSNLNPDISKLDPDPKIYAMSLIAMKRADKNTAINNIDKLISKYPHNPYLYEQKAQILTSFGDKNSLSFFTKALSLKNDTIIKIEESIAKIIFYNEKTQIQPAISHLEMNLKNFSNNITIINFLAIGHDKINNKANSIYYRALKEKLSGKTAIAKKLALSAKSLAGNNMQLLVKIDDILNVDN
jgi:predicted Zn-dependent protease